MDDAERLAGAKRCYVVAPAGCGKTELIARSLAFTQGRTLVLTHTHAGVGALRQRFGALRIPAASYHIDTIAGWALKYAASFPATSGLVNNLPDENADWANVYTAAFSVLTRSFALDIIKASYSGVLVDEYQDCTAGQHALILRIADAVPCRIVGDPLQGIFTFEDKLVDWPSDVYSKFEELRCNWEPWRWRKGNVALGDWLLEVGRRFKAGEPVDLRDRPKGVDWIELPLMDKDDKEQAKKARQETWRLHRSILWKCKAKPTCIAILQIESQRWYWAKSTPFFPVESVACKHLHEAAATVSSGDGAERVRGLIDFLKRSFTNIPLLDDAAAVVLEGRKRKHAPDDVVAALGKVMASADVANILDGVKIIERTGDLFRPELFYEFMNALNAYRAGHYENLPAAAWGIRNRTRQVGRKLSPLALGSTWLVKGLECRHGVILDADSLNTNDLYVSMTRASETLTICSTSRVLNPVKARRVG